MYITRYQLGMKKVIWRALLLMLVVLGIWHYQLIFYGISQARGQLSIIWAARELPEVMADAQVADSIKYKLQLIQEVKQFTEDHLGFKSTDNYTTYYDQNGKPSLWVVTGARPFKLEAKEWSFPFLGKVPYKGFFDYTKALHEESLLKDDWDTNLRVAGGWSTLGWFRDPVLSNMLEDPVGELANTIVHELTHGNLFIRDSVAFNENLASFFGDQGARIFLRQKYGENSPQMTQYLRGQADRRKFTDHILKGADLLDSLYTHMSATLDKRARNNFKRALINEIKMSCDTLNLYEKRRYQRFLEERQVNNAFFMSYLRYRGDFTFFERELKDKFGGDLKRYFEHFKAQNAAD